MSFVSSTMMKNGYTKPQRTKNAIYWLFLLPGACYYKTPEPRKGNKIV